MKSLLLATCLFGIGLIGVLHGDEIAKVGIGTVRLPPGFKHSTGHGYDSAVGDFTSPDGKLVINYDNGLMAGRYTDHAIKTTVDDLAEFPVGDEMALMIVASGNPPTVTISFGAANFFAEVHSTDEIKIVRRVAASFKPNPPNPYYHDDLTKSTIDGYIAQERTGNKGYGKEFWLMLYREELRSSEPWTESRFKDSADLVAYIKRRRREMGVPAYDDCTDERKKAQHYKGEPGR